MITTTLNKIREHGPCEDGWEKLLKHIGKTKADDEPLPFAVIVESNGLEDALWCCRAAPEYDKDWRLYAVWCARQVESLMTDERIKRALDVAERYANGKATDEEMEAARIEDREAEAEYAVGVAALDATWVAVRAVGYAAGVVGDTCADAAEGAAAAASGAVAAAARAAAEEAQTKRFLEVVGVTQ